MFPFSHTSHRDQKPPLFYNWRRVAFVFAPPLPSPSDPKKPSERPSTMINILFFSLEGLFNAKSCPLASNRASRSDSKFPYFLSTDFVALSPPPLFFVKRRYQEAPLLGKFYPLPFLGFPFRTIQLCMGLESDVPLFFYYLEQSSSGRMEVLLSPSFFPPVAPLLRFIHFFPRPTFSCSIRRELPAIFF